MYLSDEKRAQIRYCLERRQNNSDHNQLNNPKRINKSEDYNKVSQILFDARDGKEVFTPF
jgi:hypothetical protein